jgi:hypothetical protein
MIHSSEDHIRQQIYWGDPEVCVETEEERDEAKGSPVVVRDTAAFAKVVLPKCESQCGLGAPRTC